MAAEPSRVGGEAGRKGIEVELSTVGVVQARGKEEPPVFPGGAGRKQQPRAEVKQQRGGAHRGHKMLLL